MPACAGAAPAMAASAPASAAIPPVIRLIRPLYTPARREVARGLDTCTGAGSAGAAGEASGALDRGRQHRPAELGLALEAGGLQQRAAVGEHRVLREAGQSLRHLARTRPVCARGHDLGDEA